MFESVGVGFKGGFPPVSVVVVVGVGEGGGAVVWVVVRVVGGGMLGDSVTITVTTTVDGVGAESTVVDVVVKVVGDDGGGLLELRTPKFASEAVQETHQRTTYSQHLDKQNLEDNSRLQGLMDKPCLLDHRTR
jgi:hypothetical protein